MAMETHGPDIPPHEPEATRGMRVDANDETTRELPLDPDAMADGLPTPKVGTQPLMLASTAVQAMEPPPAITQAMPVLYGEARDRPQSPHDPTPSSDSLQSHHPRLFLALGGCVLLTVLAVAFLQPEWFGLQRAMPRLETVPQEVPEALRPFFARAQVGDTRAMRMLGLRYYYGLDVPSDKRLGRRWYQRAADAGDPMARKELAQLSATDGLDLH